MTGKLETFLPLKQRAKSSAGSGEQTKLVDDSVMLEDVGAERIPAVREIREPSLLLTLSHGPPNKQIPPDFWSAHNSIY